MTLVVSATWSLRKEDHLRPYWATERDLVLQLILCRLLGSKIQIMFVEPQMLFLGTLKSSLETSHSSGAEPGWNPVL
jgi:hypothetical protein